MPGGPKQPAKGFKLARGTTLQKANTAKKEGVKFKLLTVFETKTLFVVGNGSCHKNLNDNCMSVISLVDGDQTQWAAYAGCWSANTKPGKHCLFTSPRTTARWTDKGQMLNIHKEGQWWKMRQLGRMRRLNRRKQDEGSKSKSKTQATKNKSGNADARMN